MAVDGAHSHDVCASLRDDVILSGCMLLISERSQALREDQFGHLCARVCQQEAHCKLAQLSLVWVCVCVFMSLLGHNTANVIKQVLYCSRFLISKAFAAAMCVMNPFLFPWTFLCAFVWDVQTCRTNIGSEMHFFITPLVKRGSRVLNHLRML